MQIVIESFSDLKTTDRGPSAKIKAQGGASYYVNEDPTNLVGKTVDIEVTEKTSAKGNKYSIAKITKVHEGKGVTSNGHGVTWDEYRFMAEAAHELAKKLEPDGTASGDLQEGLTTLDRSAARAAILNTVMIAFSNGKIVVPQDDDLPF